MDILISVIKMFGGLAILIYGMKLLSTQLKKLSGGKLEKILANFTNNPIKSLLVGFFITVVTQSSATTTVIVVSLVNSGILGLRNSIPIIMGANIGTTINSQILRLANVGGDSWLALVSPGTLAPIILVISLIIMSKGKKQKTRDIGHLLLGLGLLFTGMITMVSMASSFSDLPILATILRKLSNPFLGVLAGTVITALVQSSAATIGILQAISTTGIVSWSSTIPIILGQNIGTCFTSILASLSGNKNAKRVACVHLYFNLIGTIIFLIGIYTYQKFIGFSFWNDSINMGGIANFHTIFNIASTLILFPFIKQIEKLTIFTIKDDPNDTDEDEDDNISILDKLDDRITTIPSIALSNSNLVAIQMIEMSNKNFKRSMQLLEKGFTDNKFEKIQKREDSIDKMDEKLEKYLVKLGRLNLSDVENNNLISILKLESEIEKIGDYAYKLAKSIQAMNENNIVLSQKAIDELHTAYEITSDIIKETQKIVSTRNIDLEINAIALKEVSEMKREQYKSEHIDRLKKGECNVESGIAFLEILTIYEKINHHCINAIIAIYNIVNNKKFTTKEDFSNRIYKNYSDKVKNKLNEYCLKYD